MALGTASIAPVHMLVGPGNAFVAEAKRQEPVRHGPGQYRKGNRGWYVQYDGSACWHPAGTKERAIRLLDIRTPSEWAVADIHRS